jgi:hypothetical protein
MKLTAYSTLTTNELIDFVLMMNSPSELETELVQRLTLAVDMLEESEVPYGLNAGRACQSRRQG